MQLHEYRAMAKGALSEVRSVVRYRGLNTAGGWIRDPLNIPQKFAARLKSQSLGNERSEKYKGPFDPVRYIHEMAALAKDSNTGNCSELSAVAFKFLARKQVTPIEYFGVFRGGWNHAFVVLNRPSDIPLNEFAKWSVNAVVCDPLYDRSADAGFLAAWYPRMFPLTEKDIFLRICDD
ncbi:hypothetical protein [Bryobacter aggregatus]|uniref:hypothetical protein n=1 Tax=Bryobacter aggregatus TaxID=360054 RepID=UPI0012BA6224|nr:hypothetical protein [Bryobacter aggregatus]